MKCVNDIVIEEIQNNKTNSRMRQSSIYTLIFDKSVVITRSIKLMIHKFSNVALLIGNSEVLPVLPN